MRRQEVYDWLAEQLKIPVAYCHVSMFDIHTCRKVVELCAEYRVKIVANELASMREPGVDWSDLA